MVLLVRHSGAGGQARPLFGLARGRAGKGTHPRSRLLRPAGSHDALVDLPEWRATLQARRAWQAILQTRINQQQDLIQALGAVVDAAEAQALPALRDLLLATAGDAARGLLIDLASGAAQRTTRLDQAIETLQGALFAVRVGAGAAVLTQVLDVLSRT